MFCCDHFYVTKSRCIHNFTYLMHSPSDPPPECLSDFWRFINSFTYLLTYLLTSTYWGQSWYSVKVVIPQETVINPVVGFHQFLSGLQFTLPLISSVPNYTACWQRYVKYSNCHEIIWRLYQELLPDSETARSQTIKLSVARLLSLTITPRDYTITVKH